jgi:probable F420-dependent oxidoreductase
LILGAQLAERQGFDSVWVRDHIVYHPHGMESDDRTHVDPFVALSLVAGATERIVLGTAALIPHRHPIQTALALSSLEFVAGPGRVIAGVGLGRFDHEFDAVGLGDADRTELVREQVAVVRALWGGREVDHDGQHYSFRGVDIHPSPSSQGGIPIWFCGIAPGAVRRAVEFCDGWMPGRITVRTLRARIALLRRLSDTVGRPSLSTAAIPIVSLARTREEALSYVNWRAILRSAPGAGWESPASESWSSPDDLEGVLLAGPPDVVAAAVSEIHSAGVDHVVFDLRFRFADWPDCLQRVGEDVLPILRGRGPQPRNLT